MNKQSKIKYGSLDFFIGSEGFDDIQPWLVKGFFSKHSFGVIYGKPGSRKSFLAIDISCSIATGTPWQNKEVAAGAVVYVAAEGQTGMSRRVKAWEIANGKKVNNLYMLGQSVLLSDISARSALIDSINDIETQSGLKVELIVLDTLARNFEGDENSSDAMGKFIRGCDLVKELTNTTILCIHHCGKDVTKGVRGSSALIGACDFEFQVTHNMNTHLTTLCNTKQKDAEAAPDHIFEFQTIDLGIVCEEGEPITSLALLTPATLKNTKNGNNSPMLKVLRDTFSGSCTREELRTYCFPQKEGVAANTTNQKFKRALTALVEENLVSVHQKGETANRSDIIIAV